MEASYPYLPLFQSQGLGVALLADWLVREDIERGRLVPLLERFTAPPAPVFALSPPGRFSSATGGGVPSTSRQPSRHA